MKRAVFYKSVFLLGLFLAFVSGCQTESLESCEQDEICEGKTVQACCTVTKCYYVYNGVEYGDDAASLANLATALGCAKAGSITFKEDNDDLILRLEALGEIARTREVK